MRIIQSRGGGGKEMEGDLPLSIIPQNGIRVIDHMEFICTSSRCIGMIILGQLRTGSASSFPFLLESTESGRAISRA